MQIELKAEAELWMAVARPDVGMHGCNSDGARQEQEGYCESGAVEAN